MDVENVQTECSSLAKVATAFSVPISVVRKWRKECDALSPKCKPYNLVDIAWYLLANRLRTAEDLPPAVMRAIADSFAADATYFGKLNRMLTKLRSGDLAVKGNIDAVVKKAVVTAAQPSPLLSGESGVIAIASPKTAALFVDRVWTLDKKVPAEIEFDFGTWEEKMFRGVVSAGIWTGLEAWYGKKELHTRLEADDQLLSDEIKRGELLLEQGLAPILEARLCSPIQKASGRSITPFMSTELAMSKLHQAGDFQAVAVTINSMKLIDEAQLTWDHVREFRCDLESRKKLRRFLHWMDGELLGKPLNFVQDELCIRLENYEQAITSWGINTTMGAFSTLVDAKTWMGIFAAGVAASAGIPPDIVATVGLIALGLTVVHNVAKISMEENSRLRQDEIAYLYDAKRLSP